MSSRGVLALSAAVALVLGACGDDDDVDLVGTYEAELGSSGDLLVEPNPEGRWQLTIDEESAVLVTPQGDRFPPGDPIVVEGDTIMFSADPDCPTQQGAAREGVYDFELDDGALTLVEVNDSCRDRAFVLTEATWTSVDD